MMAMSPSMAVTLERRPGVAVVHLTGHLGIDGRPGLKAACEACLADPEIRELRLDLAGIESADTTALALLLVVRERARGLGRQVSLTGCGGCDGRRPAIAGVEKHFSVV